MDQAKPIDPQLLKDVQDTLKKAKITLMMQKNTSFYTSILFSLKQLITEEIPTAATDGRSLLINPGFFMNMPFNERITLLAHEVLHVALDHMHRLGERDPKLWNVAADYVINGHLVKAGYTLPKGGLHDIKYDGKSTEEVYDILYKKSPSELVNILKPCTNGSGAMNGQDIQYPKDAKPGQEVTQDEVTAIILRAATNAKAAGDPPGCVPGEIEISLKRVINPPLPWHIILQNYLNDFTKNDYSFKRPNRRFLPDHYLPTAYSEALTHLAIAVDTSGSVSDKQFLTFITKIAEIQETIHPKKITVIAFDTKIKNVQELREDSDPFKTLKFTGRGGTAIGPVHEWVQQNKPNLMLIFTDGEFTWVDPKYKNCPLLWLIHDNPKWKAKHGRTIYYDIGC